MRERRVSSLEALVPSHKMGCSWARKETAAMFSEDNRKTSTTAPNESLEQLINDENETMAKFVQNESKRDSRGSLRSDADNSF